MFSLNELFSEEYSLRFLKFSMISVRFLFFLFGILLCTAGQNIALDTNGGLPGLRFHVASVKSRMTGASVADQKGCHITFHGYLDVVFLLGVINHLVIVGEL